MKKQSVTYYTKYDHEVLADVARGLTNQLVRYVKERKKSGSFETSEVNPSEAECWRQIGLSIEDDLNPNMKRVSLFIEYGNGTSKNTMFAGNEGKLRTWIEGISGTLFIYHQLSDLFFEWVNKTGH